MTRDPRSQPSSDGLLERLKEESLRLQRRSFDSADAGMSANLCDEAIDRIRELEGALRFYRDEWRLNGDGDSETPGLSRSWMEPTDALHDDEGRKAADALQPKAGS